MAPRAENPNSLSGPTGPSLLDQSKATPADINPEIFKSRNPERQPTEGTVSSDYLKRTREEDPWPAESSCAPKSRSILGIKSNEQSVTLQNCEITTSRNDLRTNHPFEMEVMVHARNGADPNYVIFRLFCQVEDGPVVRLSRTIIAKLAEDGVTAKAKSSLLMPAGQVPYGARLKYHVVAEHPLAKGKLKSSIIEVEMDSPPPAFGIWSMDEIHFSDYSPFILPTAGPKIAELASLIEKWPDSLIGIYGHAYGGAFEEFNRHHAGVMAFALYCLLTRHVKGWEFLELEEGWCGPVKKTGGIKGERNVGSHLDFMNSICNINLPPDRFIGYVSGEIAGCFSCGSINPMEAERKTMHSNSSKGRVTVVFIDTGDRSMPSCYGRFPCMPWFEYSGLCTRTRRKLINEAEIPHKQEHSSNPHHLFRPATGCRFYREYAVQESGHSITG